MEGMPGPSGLQAQNINSGCSEVASQSSIIQQPEYPFIDYQNQPFDRRLLVWEICSSEPGNSPLYSSESLSDGRDPLPGVARSLGRNNVIYSAAVGEARDPSVVVTLQVSTLIILHLL